MNRPDGSERIGRVIKDGHANGNTTSEEASRSYTLRYLQDLVIENVLASVDGGHEPIRIDSREDSMFYSDVYAYPPIKDRKQALVIGSRISRQLVNAKNNFPGPRIQDKEMNTFLHEEVNGAPSVGQLIEAFQAVKSGDFQAVKSVVFSKTGNHTHMLDFMGPGVTFDRNPEAIRVSNFPENAIDITVGNLTKFLEDGGSQFASHIALESFATITELVA
jgi:hypothetical protein